MSSKSLQNKDSLAGIVFMLFGLLAFVISCNYESGSLLDMGPGYFPRILSVLLTVLGALILLRGVKSRQGEGVSWAFLPLGILSLSMVLFGFLVERLGLVPSLAVLVLVSAAAGSEFKLREVAVLAAVVCLFAVVVFVWGLKMRFPLFAWGF